LGMGKAIADLSAKIQRYSTEWENFLDDVSNEAYNRVKKFDLALLDVETKPNTDLGDLDVLEDEIKRLMGELNDSMKEDVDFKEYLTTSISEPSKPTPKEGDILHLAKSYNNFKVGEKAEFSELQSDGKYEVLFDMAGGVMKEVAYLSADYFEKLKNEATATPSVLKPFNLAIAIEQLKIALG
jgi:hypothetical protein